MPNHRDPETLLIRRQEGEEARKRRPPLRGWPSSPRVPPTRQSQPAAISGRLRDGLLRLAPGHEKPPPLRLPGTLTATRLKVTTTLNAAELLAVPVPVGKLRVTLRIRLLPDRALTAEIAAKSLRRALRAIREAGADDIALVLQGHMTAGDTIAQARPVRAAESAKSSAAMTRLPGQNAGWGNAFG